MVDVAVGALPGLHLLLAPLSNTPTWSHLSIRQIFLQLLPMHQALNSYFILPHPTSV